MNRRICVVLIILILVAGVGALFLMGSYEPDNDVFDNGGRYDSTILNNMGVIYSDQSNITYFNDGYSESDSCPWGFIHNGIDYFFHNDSVVIAAAPGVVQSIELRYLEGTDYYKVGVQIRFNESVWIEYGFEGFANDTSNRAQQAAMLGIEVGDWVSKGDGMGRFLRVGEFDHVHFGVYLNDEAICPRRVMGEADYNEIMNLIHNFHPTWELCYP
ncbi:MAG: hypothetical protein ACFFED_00055 [Candidatus Thorarchaeota archaeon]